MKTIARAVFRSVLRQYPFYSGCGTIANMRPFEWATEDIEGPVNVKIRNGLRLCIDPKEFLGRSIYYTREWDPKITWAIERILRKGDTFLDIGSHCGISSLVAAGVVGREGAVHAFDPQPKLTELLRKTAALNDLPQLRVHGIALSSEDRQAELHIQFDKPILASLDRVDAPGQTIFVPARKTGDYLRALDLQPIRLVKIDVEGHEIEILNGSAGFFERENKPQTILFESIDAEGAFWQRPVVRWLQNLDYVFYALPKQMLRMRAVRVNGRSTPGWHDFVAVAPDAMDDLKPLLDA